MQPISTDFLGEQTEGYVFSFEDLARLVPEEAGNLYRTAHGRSLTNNFTDRVRGTELTKLRPFAQPTILGTVRNISAGPNITAGGIVIKDSGSFEMAIPECLKQFAPAAHHVGKDLLGLYGAQAFEKSAIQLIVQRTDIEPGKAHREPFSNWHNHLDTDRGRRAEIDLLYCFSDKLPTQLRRGRTQLGGLTRFGAEIEHLSPSNPTDSPLRRTWGGFVVTPFESPNTYSDNMVEDARGELRDTFKANAVKFLQQRGTRFFEPQAAEPVFA
jgi:hypothetical protein